MSYLLITGNPLYDNPFFKTWIIYFVFPYADYCTEYLNHLCFYSVLEFPLFAFLVSSLLKTCRFLALRRNAFFFGFARLLSQTQSANSLRSSIRKSPRPISITRLNMLPHLQLWPINVVICNGTYLVTQ